MGKLYRHDPTGIPKIQNQGMQINDHPRIDVRDPDAPEQPPSFQSSSSFKTNKVNGTVVGIGRNFEGNHLYDSNPADNAIAISDSGLIVSLDNSTVAYFKENGDTIVKYGLPLANWYQDSTFDRGPFDGRLIYDRDQDRFIAVMIYHSLDYSDSRILVSFSKPLGLDSISWNHCQINIDSIYTDAGEEMFWADFPSIAINKDELFISALIANRDTMSGSNTLARTLLLQIEKAGGYAGAPQLVCKEWKDVKNADDVRDGSLVPAGEAFQALNYGPGCYLVSNYPDNSTKFYWYELTGGINDTNATIIRHLSASSFFYSYPSYASQLGGNTQDRMDVGDCRIHTAIYQNGKIHFVLMRSDNGWAEVVYANINVIDNSFTAETWGGLEENLNSFYPSMAPYGQDSTEESFMIAFQRSGPTKYPELCVINFDSTWSPAATVVRQGDGILDLRDFVFPWDTLERFGDYSAIHRRFNDPKKACWIAGSYAAGPLPNHFGLTNGIKTWIAEVGDSLILGLPTISSTFPFEVFPNPIVSGNTNLHFRLPVKHDAGILQIVDLQGHSVFSTKFKGSSFSLEIPEIPAGLYFINLNSKKNNYETKKLLVYR
jgi:hypothetical protein